MTLKLMRVYQRAAPTTQAANPYQTGIFSVSSPAPMIVLSPTLLWPIFSVNSPAPMIVLSPTLLWPLSSPPRWALVLLFTSQQNIYFCPGYFMYVYCTYLYKDLIVPHNPCLIRYFDLYMLNGFLHHKNNTNYDKYNFVKQTSSDNFLKQSNFTDCRDGN